MSSQSDVDGVAICDRLLYLLDGIKYDTDDPMANPPKQNKKQVPRTELERRQRIIALDDDFNQLCIRNPGYGTEGVSWLPAGQEILQQMEIMKKLAGKLPNYIQIKLIDNKQTKLCSMNSF